jgi:hypothetical protein
MRRIAQAGAVFRDFRVTTRLEAGAGYSSRVIFSLRS